MKLNSNIPAVQVLQNLNKATKGANSAMQRLSTGMKINCSSDDPAGFAIARKLNAQAKGLNQAGKNTMDAISLIQTAEGALNEVQAMVQRIRTLTVQAGSGSNGPDELSAIQSEIDELINEVESIQNNTEFNEKGLLNRDSELIMHTGANMNQEVTLKMQDVNLDSVIEMLNEIDMIDLYNSGTGNFAEDNGSNITRADDCISSISKMRSYLGACQNRFEYTNEIISNSEYNMTSALSTIQDADMATEMTEYTQKNVLTQASNSILAQANQRPQQVLQLLNQ